MVVIDVLEAVPVIFRIQLPALDGVDVVRLPYVEEPAFALITQTLDLFTEGDGAIDGVLDQPLAGVATHHGGGDLGRGHDAVLRRGGGVHHEGFVEGLFLHVALDVDHRRLGEGRQQLVGGLGFVEHLARHGFAAHAALAFVDRAEVGVGHPGTVEVDVGGVQRLLDEAGVVEQAVIGGVGDHGVARRLGTRGGGDLGCNGLAAEFALRDAAQNAVGVAGRTEVEWGHVVHHHQVSERLVAVAIHQHCAAGRRRVHADDLVGGGGAIGDDVGAIGVESTGDVLLGFFVRA